MKAAAPARVACVLVPELLAAARLRAEPDLAGRPFAIASERGTRAVLLSVSRKAQERGVFAGASLAHARAICPELAVRVADPAPERAARAALLDVALSASPRAMLESEPGTSAAAVVLDASGLSRVFSSEAALAGALVERARSQGLPAVVAVAATRALARVAARDAAQGGPGTTRLVAAGAETGFLAPLSVDLLAPSDATAELLTRFGVYRLGALLALAPATVATRLGPELATALARLRGAVREPPIPAPRALRIEEALALDAPLADAEPFLFVLGGLLSRVFARLALRHLACGAIEIELGLDAAAGDTGAGRHALRLALAAPSADTRVWLRRVRMALERDPPRAPVATIAVATEGIPARRDQLDLFRPAGPAPAALDALVAELELLCGEGRVGAPRIPDDPHPDAIATKAFGSPDIESSDPNLRNAPPALALRLLRPPLPAQVQLRAGQPASLRSAVANGDVLRCAGPWRTTGAWWSETDRFAYDHYDVATSDGLLVRLRRDLVRAVWQIDAIYD
jgi:protein ImuB